LTEDPNEWRNVAEQDANAAVRAELKSKMLTLSSYNG
jgi:hypothetical protein